MWQSGAVNSPKEGLIHDEQRNGRPSLISDGGRLLWLRDTEASSRLNKCLDSAGDYVEIMYRQFIDSVAFVN